MACQHAGMRFSTRAHHAKVGRAWDQQWTNAKKLEDFKSRIDLRQYAASMGYTLDRRESWRGNAVMRNPADDKIIIKIEGDGHWVYCSCREMAMMERSSILFNAVDD